MIRIRQIKIEIAKNNLNEIKKYIAHKLKIKDSTIKTIKINKQSLDARRKNNICYIYEVDAEIENEKNILKKNISKDVFESPIEKYHFNACGKEKLNNRPIVVGSGPAGLFTAYLLAQYGYKPIIIERGKKVEERVKSIEEFWKTGKLDFNSNVQFGEGGAGTFSDGKLNTLVKDKEFRMKKVFEIFVKHGAPKEIMYVNKPHIGTDILRDVIINIRNEIIKNGGEFRYDTKLTNIIFNNNKLESIEVNNHEIINCDVLVLAIGHSARDTFEMLYKNNLEMTSKPFAVGIRIQHSQELINKSQYGNFSDMLEPASYKLTYKAGTRGVYSFCMCPGGYVVDASSEHNRLAINGMSNYKRDSSNANSAIIVTISPKDFGPNALDGIKFQRTLEEKAYKVGQGKIPIQLYKDFCNNKVSKEFKSIKPVFKGNYTFANLNDIFPSYISDSLKEGIAYFDTKIKGFGSDDAILAGVESRTSSPVKIIRNEEYNSNILGIYPCGEGAGYAGGITTSAMDGIKMAEMIAKKYKRID